MTAASDQGTAAPGRRAVSTATRAGTADRGAAVARFPSRPLASTWPATQAGRSAVLARILAPPFALDHPASQQNRRLGLLAVVNWLQTQPGDSWQHRWRASGAEDQQRLAGRDHRCGCRSFRAGTATGTQLPHLSPGLLVLICADVIRPSLRWLLARPGAARPGRGDGPHPRPRRFAALADVAQAGSGTQAGQQALARIAVIMAAKGGLVADVARRGLPGAAGGRRRVRANREAHARSPLFYQLLHAHGVLGEDAPAAIEVFSGRGQPSCEQLIDRYRIACRPVRDVLVDYLRERQRSVDFSSLQRLAYLLGKLFWADLEAHHPGIDSLKLPRDVAAAWKQR